MIVLIYSKLIYISLTAINIATKGKKKKFEQAAVSFLAKKTWYKLLHSSKEMCPSLSQRTLCVLVKSKL